eukprot:TRINITY_DN13706_c0_g1_i1.p1 TRINITY_DN13706_c0_g1~~TRINITY_DN13706_c0_g1_i1.p1  ORF type:complete len:245 (-),score=31.20 TRINITY_DN13706_c0_g1_i1:197-931(-)
MKDSIVTELETLNLLYVTQHEISQLEFRKSLFLLYQSNSEVHSWSHKYLNPSDLTPLNGGLMLWTRKFLATLASKLCFYYYNSFIAESQSIWENMPDEINFVQMVKSFIDSSGCQNFALVDTNCEHSSDCWRCIFSYPQISPPQDQWEAIIGNISGSQQYSNKFENRTLFFTDTCQQILYFVSKAEHNIYMVVTTSQSSEEEDFLVRRFLEEMMSKLRFWGLANFGTYIDDTNVTTSPSVLFPH